MVKLTDRATTKNNIKIFKRNSKGQFPKGENHPNWKGGVRLDSSGYRIIYSPYHPYKNSFNAVREHRLVYEEYLTKLNGIKTYLHPSIEVHHINEIKTDNRIENLQLVTRSEHMSIHRQIDMSDRMCALCGSDKTYKDSKTGNPCWHRYDKDYICGLCRERRRRAKKKNL